MNGSPIHDLLDAVSADRPIITGPTVEDLVRAGRRRRRALPVAAAGAAILVVAGASALVTLPGSHGRVARPSTSSPKVMTTTARPDDGQPVPRVGAGRTTPVTSLQLVGGKQLVAFASQCLGPATLTAVETGTTVRVSLSVTISPASSSCTGAATPVTTTLKAPLGNRQAVDASTGYVVPVTTSAQQLVTAEVPGGFKPAGPITPVSARSWRQWFIPVAAATVDQADEVIVLTQRPADGAGIGGAATDMVGGSWGRVVRTRTTIGVTWPFESSLVTLTYRSVSGCDFAEVNNKPAPVGHPCRPVASPTLMPKWQLLRMADMVYHPPGWWKTP